VLILTRLNPDSLGEPGSILAPASLNHVRRF